jgi:hypothetical protein
MTDLKAFVMNKVVKLRNFGSPFPKPDRSLNNTFQRYEEKDFT